MTVALVALELIHEALVEAGAVVDAGQAVVLRLGLDSYNFV